MGESYQLSKITNHSAKWGKRKCLFGSQKAWAWVQMRPTTLAPGPATLHGVALWLLTMLPFLPCSLYTKCLPWSVFTVPTICQSQCGHHGWHTCWGFHMLSAWHILITTHPPLLRSSLYPESPMPILSKIPAFYSFLLTIPTLNIPVMWSPACSVTQKLLCSLHLSCMLCGAPAQEASLLAPQTEGMCLPGDSTGEIRGLTAERGSAKTEGEERNRETERWHEREWKTQGPRENKNETVEQHTLTGGHNIRAQNITSHKSSHVWSQRF